MVRVAVAMLMIGGLAAWGQTPNDTAASSVKADKATAYYHYMLSHMYAEMAYGSRNPEYAEKAMENLKLAVKADPQSALLAEELARGGTGRRFPSPTYRPVPRQGTRP